MQLMKPIIGLTLDSEEAGGYATVPWYALRKNYCEAVSAAGGVPLPLPHYQEGIDAYVSKIDGLIVTGGGFDVPPSLYGVDTHHPTTKLKPERTEFEHSLTQKCLEQGKPVFGICGGMQLINVIFGGTLIQDIESYLPESLPHKQSAPYNRVFHPITIHTDSLLYQLSKHQNEIHVNSVHHQAVDRVGKGLRVSATAPDGVIEAIEHTGNIYCTGVQWHPEYNVNLCDTALFDAFVAACRNA